jgi:hypothetical protein
MRRPAVSRPRRSAPARRGARPVRSRSRARCGCGWRAGVTRSRPTVDRILEAVGPGGARRGSPDRPRRGPGGGALQRRRARPSPRSQAARRHRAARFGRMRGGGSLRLRIGFDAHAVHDPTSPERQLAPGGRGIFLMRRLVDEVSYNASGNTVRLTVRQGPERRRRELRPRGASPPTVALSLASVLFVLAGLEGLCRLFDREPPAGRWPATSRCGTTASSTP